MNNATSEPNKTAKERFSKSDEVAPETTGTGKHEGWIMDQYWDSVRQKICRKCIDGDGKGGCRLPIDDSCGLEVFFPEIVQTVSSVHSSSLQDYVTALRANVCANCDHQFEGGTCRKRDTLECALDRYYPIVIDVIESLRNPAVESHLGPP